MKILNFTNDECEAIWKILASILHLGNVEFLYDSNSDTNQIHSSSKNTIRTMAQLLQVNEAELSKTLCQRVIAAGGEVMAKQHVSYLLQIITFYEVSALLFLKPLTSSLTTFYMSTSSQNNLIH